MRTLTPGRQMLLADIGAVPPDLGSYVGVLVVGALMKSLIDRLLHAGERERAAAKVSEAKADAERKALEAKAEAERKAADAEWRAEMKHDLKHALELLGSSASTQALQAKDIAMMQQRLDGIEKRADTQATTHRDAIQALRSEFNLLVRGTPTP